ncbi:MAG: hypothetical protein GYA22_03780 [Bacteroidales bacterium]|nr:hypothetical protein [Bacteroidales bacterium]
MRKFILFIAVLSGTGFLYLRAQNNPTGKNYIGINTVPLWENLAKKDTFSPFAVIYERLLNNNRELVVESDLYFNHQHESDAMKWALQYFRTWITAGINVGYYFTRSLKRFSFAYGAGIGYKVNAFNLRAQNYASGWEDEKQYLVWCNRHYQTQFFSFYPSCRLRFQVSSSLRIETEAKLPFQYQLNRFWGTEEYHFFDESVRKVKYLEPYSKSMKIGIIPFYAINLMFNF